MSKRGKSQQINIRLEPDELDGLIRVAVAMTARTGKLLTRSEVVRTLIRNAVKALTK